MLNIVDLIPTRPIFINYSRRCRFGTKHAKK
nr:MAG TPA: hypothetical protein [Caudoviricetes sp.]